MKKVLVLCLMIPFFAVSLFGEEIGEVVYYQGDVQLRRDGRNYSDEVDFGYPVENFDTISCEANGLAEVAVDPSTGVDGAITVHPNSSFYFDLAPAKKEQKAAIELLAGSVALSVKKLAGTSRLNVRTQSATMGVRGTTFRVSVSVSGGVLCTCEEGTVECRDDQGRTLFAKPGQVVEKSADGLFRNIPVSVSNLEEFRSNWIAEKVDAFKADALRAISDFSRRYLDLRERFSQAYRELMQEREVITKWINEDEQGRIGGTMEVMREKKALIGPLMRMRGVLFIFERIYFRVLEMYRYYQQGHGRGIIRPGYSAADFFRTVANDRDRLADRMSMVRYVMKLYAKRNEGTVPASGLSGFGEGSEFFDEESEDDFFETEDDFF